MSTTARRCTSLCSTHAGRRGSHGSCPPAQCLPVRPAPNPVLDVPSPSALSVHHACRVTVECLFLLSRPVVARCACLTLQPAGAHTCPGPHRVRCHGESARGRPLGYRSGPVCPPGCSRGYHFLRKTYVAHSLQGSSHLDVCSLSLCHPDGDTSQNGTC